MRDEIYLRIFHERYPDIVRRFSGHRDRHIGFIRELIKEFKEEHRLYVRNLYRFQTQAIAPDLRKRILGKFERVAAEKKQILAHYADLKRCIRMADRVLFGVSPDERHLIERRSSAKDH
jgi:hypothetical protein